MRWTQTFIPTLKETPAEAEITSHKLLLRAGLARKLTGGLYIFLPLGLRALRKIEQIVREEMDRAGALEVLMPALQPPDLWRQSGRYDALAEALFKVHDRARKEWVLGPTHEEVITTLAAGEIKVVYCESGQYAANIEKATSQGPLEPTPQVGTGPAPEKFSTPGVLTIEALAAAPYHVAAHQQIKTLVYLVGSQPMIALLRGDDQLNEAKFAGALGTAQFRAATPEEIFMALGAHPGSLGAVAATLKPAELPILADEALR